jgi:hypothetical protein
MIVKNLFIFISLFLLNLSQGCAVIGNGNLKNSNNPPDLNYLPVLIPFFLGGHGTAIPITDSVSLTAAHVAKYDYSTVIAYHPYCDVALVKSNNKDKNKLEIGLVYSGEKVTNYGYDFTGEVVKGEGMYIMDVEIESYPKCDYSLNDAPQKSGMSGGAVLNNSGKLVGVIHGIGKSPPVMIKNNKKVHLDRYSYFVSINFIRDWLDYYIR